MKNFNKLITIFLATCIFASFSCIASFASVSSPNCDLSGKHPTFTWTGSGSDTLYAIRGWYDSSSYSLENRAFSNSGIKSTSYTTVFGLEAGRSCRYQITSYSAGSTPSWSGTSTQDINIPSCPEVSAPHSVSAAFTHKSMGNNDEKLGEIVQKDNSITIKWSVDNPSDFSRFEIVRTSTEDKLKLVATVPVKSNKNYTYTYYSIGGKFDYEVRGFVKMDNCNSIYVASEKVSAPKVGADMLTDSTIKENLWWTAVAKKTITLYKSPGKKPYATVSKGTSRKATWKFSPTKFDFWDEPKWVQVHYKGQKVWAKWSQVEMKWHITHKDYPWSVKEKFINQKKWKSKTNYIIWINRYCQRTNVFKKDGSKWKLIKVYDCNTGNYYQPLKGGQYYIKGHAPRTDKIHRDGREYYFLYSTKFGGSGTFHTRCRWSDNDSLRNSIKRHPTTKGCDRLYDAAAQYVYKLPIGTGVVIK